MLTAVIIFAVIAAAALLYAASRPDSFHLERSATVNAPPEKVFPLISDFSGKGAVYEWQGRKAGTGRMEILDAPSPSKVDIKLDFIKPFEAHNKALFVLEPQGPSTKVTWSMDGPQPFIAKLMSLFFSMDRVVGKDFEKGLAAMKVAAEE